jgi:hypothetical protein
MDDLWQRNQFTYAALLLGESELGPYHYQDLRGVVDARRYLKKVCPSAAVGRTCPRLGAAARPRRARLPAHR